MDDETCEDDNETELLQVHLSTFVHDLARTSGTIKQFGVEELGWRAQGPDLSAVDTAVSGTTTDVFETLN